MKGLLLFAALFISSMIAAGPASAQEPKPAQPKDTLPPPQEVPLPRVVPPFVIISRPEIGQRNVWELYSVNSRGQMVPRVVMAPGGYYYAANGQPYPWAVTGSRSYMPLAVD